MEENQIDQSDALNQMYAHAANLMFEQNRTPEEVKTMLVAEGLDEENATKVVEYLSEQAAVEKKKAAKNDMLYGALWCIGGTVATLAEVGYIFWGAIVFGAFQFIRGAYSS